MTSLYARRNAAAAAALAAALLALPAHASSTTSDSASQLVGSLSTSLGKSSDSSSKKNDVADGDYRIIDVAAMPERPGHVRVTLQATDAARDDGPFYLYLPEVALQQAALAQGQTVTATHRDYGVAFAKAGQPFFLVLQDAWYRELPSHAVVL